MNSVPNKENRLQVYMFYYIVQMKNLQNSIIDKYQEKIVAPDIV